jgi:hypothetical protein
MNIQEQVEKFEKNTGIKLEATEKAMLEYGLSIGYSQGMTDAYGIVNSNHAKAEECQYGSFRVRG